MGRMSATDWRTRNLSEGDKGLGRLLASGGADPNKLGWLCWMVRTGRLGGPRDGGSS